MTSKNRQFLIGLYHRKTAILSVFKTHIFIGLCQLLALTTIVINTFYYKVDQLLMALAFAYNNLDF